MNNKGPVVIKGMSARELDRRDHILETKKAREKQKWNEREKELRSALTRHCLGD